MDPWMLVIAHYEAYLEIDVDELGGYTMGERIIPCGLLHLGSPLLVQLIHLLLVGLGPRQSELRRETTALQNIPALLHGET